MRDRTIEVQLIWYSNCNWGIDDIQIDSGISNRSGVLYQILIERTKGLQKDNALDADNQHSNHSSEKKDVQLRHDQDRRVNDRSENDLNNTAIETADTNVITPSHDKQLHVLLIDDDADINHVFQLALTRIGYLCDTAYSGKQALYKLANSRPDLVILDMRLGREIDGSDILYQIRSNPRFDQTRVIVMTAYPMMAEEVNNLADLVLIKPVTIQDLQELLERLKLTIQDGSEKRTGDNKAADPFDSFRDPITGLFNRNYFYTRLEHAMESARRRPDTLFATFVVGFDPAKSRGTRPLNGQRNQLLRQVADRMRLNLRPNDAIARLNKNSFATLHEGLRRPQDTCIIMERLDDTLTPPYMLEKEVYQLEFSMGAAIHDRRYSNIQEIISAAQGAMLQASHGDRGRRMLVTSFGDQPVAL